MPPRPLVLLLFVLVLSPAARAQVSVSFRLEGGRLIVDGREAETTTLPGFAPRQHGQFSFVGPAGATVEVRGVRYRVSGPDRLELDTRLDAAPDAVFMPTRRVLLPASAVRFIATDEVAAYAAQQEIALESQALQLAAEIRSLPPGAERTALMGHLRLHLAHTFDLKQVLRARELDRFEADLHEMRRSWQRRQLHRDGLVERRLVQLVGPGM